MNRRRASQKHRPDQTDVNEQRREIKPLGTTHRLEVRIRKLKSQLCTIIVRHHAADSSMQLDVPGRSVLLATEREKTPHKFLRRTEDETLKSPVLPVVHQHIVHGLTVQVHTQLCNREYLPITRNNSCVRENKGTALLDSCFDCVTVKTFEDNRVTVR